MPELTNTKSKLLILAGDINSGFGSADRYKDLTITAWQKAIKKKDINVIVNYYDFHRKLQEKIQGWKTSSFHQHIASLHQSAAYDVTIITTDIDDLFIRAGIPETKVHNTYGNIYLRRCMACKHTFKDEMARLIDKAQIDRCPQPRCRSKFIKNDVLLRRERLHNMRTSIRVFDQMKAGDLIVMVDEFGINFKSTHQLWRKCRQRGVQTIHVSLNDEQHSLFPADQSLKCTVDQALDQLDMAITLSKMVDDLTLE